jgi:hypothetical protein
MLVAGTSDSIFPMFQCADLLFEVAPNCFGPPIGNSNPGRGTRIDTAVQRLIRSRSFYHLSRLKPLP